MLPTTLFRHLYKRPGLSLCKGLTDLLQRSTGCHVGIDGSTTDGATISINCLNHYAAAIGLTRTSLFNMNQYRRWHPEMLRLYADSNSHLMHLSTAEGRSFIKDALEKKRERFRERKRVIVEDIRVARSKVKERVRVKMKEVIMRENIMTIPNLLTVGRAILSPYIGYVIIENDFKFAMSLLLVAGVTDMLDGQIARRWPNQASKAGSFLDPMADKLLIGSLVIAMGYCNLLPVWLAGTILFRDVFLMAAGFIIRYISLPPPRTLSRYFDVTHVTAQLEPTFISKVNTFVQLATIGISLGAPIWNYCDHTMLPVAWYLTGATTVAAALSYILRKDTFKIISSSGRRKRRIESKNL